MGKHIQLSDDLQAWLVLVFIVCGLIGIGFAWGRITA